MSYEACYCYPLRYCTVFEITQFSRAVITCSDLTGSWYPFATFGHGKLRTEIAITKI